MPSMKLEELKQDVEELNRLLVSAQRQRVKDLLLIEIRKLEIEMSNLKEVESKAGDAQVPPIAAPIKPKCYDVKLNNYAWDQSDKFIKIFVTLKNVQTLEEGNVQCTFSKRCVEMNVRGLDCRNYQLIINNLLEEVDTVKSSWKVKTDMVVVFLAKSKPGSTWSHMTGSEKKAKEPKLPKLGPEDDPSAGLMDMMKQMYDDGDDEMKRTIAKAWTESRDKQMANF